MEGKINFDSYISNLNASNKVYAINNTGTDLVEGNKVWLNKHYLSSYDATSGVVGLAKNYVGGAYLAMDNGDVISYLNQTYSSSSSGVHKYTFANSTWTSQEKYKVGLSKVNKIVDYDGVLVARTLIYDASASTAEDVVLNEDTYYQVLGHLIRKDLVLRYSASKVVNLCAYDYTTGTIGEVYSTLSLSTNNVCGCELFGNILALSEQSNTIEFWDISDLTNPIRLKVNSTVTGYNIVCATGTSVGDYIIGGASYDEKGNNYNVRHYIYKIAENYQLVDATDIPEQLYNMINQVSYVNFDTRSNILCIGTTTEIEAYKYEDGVFTSLNLGIDLSEKTPLTDCPFCFSISPNLTTLALNYKTASEYSAYCFYHYSTTDNNWYADDYTHSIETSLTGYATGNVDDSGLYEINTVLPTEEVTFTVENGESNYITESTAKIEVLGEEE